MNLKLNLYFLHNNRGCLVFKRNSVLYRINNLENALHFLANMDQLRMAISMGGSKDCLFVLKDRRGKEWLLSCKAADKVMVLDVKLKSNIADEAPCTVFNWNGTVAEFDLAVKDLTSPYRK